MTQPPLLLAAEWMAELQGRKAVPATNREGPWRPCSFLLLGGDRGDRATLLAFHPGDRRPSAVVKTGTSLPVRLRLKNEFHHLCALRDTVPESDRWFFPHPLGFREWDTCAAVGQQAIAGGTLFHRLRQPRGMRVGDLKTLVESILAQLRRVAGRIPAPPAPPAQESVRSAWKESLRALKDRGPAPGTPAEPVGEVLDRLARKTDTVAKSVFQHGDLFPKNIVLPPPADNVPFVLIDWADAGHHLPPLFDVVVLFTTLWHTGRGPVTEAERLEHFRRMFWAPGPLDQVLERAVRSGREDWGLGDEWSREDILLLSLAVYTERLRALYDESNAEVQIAWKNIEFVLSRMTGHPA